MLIIRRVPFQDQMSEEENKTAPHQGSVEPWFGDNHGADAKTKGGQSIRELALPAVFAKEK